MPLKVILLPGTIYRLPDGELIGPWVIFNPQTGRPWGSPDDNPTIPSSSKDRDERRRGDANTLQALAGVYATKDNLPEKLRGAAEKFIATATEHWANEHSGEQLEIIVSAFPGGVERGNQPGGGSSGACEGILKAFYYQLDHLGIPKAQVPGWEKELGLCFGVNSTTYKDAIKALNAGGRTAQDGPTRAS